MTERTALYRHFDEDGTLLYVGISLSAVSRLSQHSTGARWFQWITRVEVEWHQTREKAEQAEIKAIHNEGPIFNIVHANPGAQAVHLKRAAERANEAEAAVRALEAKHKAEPKHPLTPDGYTDPVWLVRQVIRDGFLSDGQQRRLII